MTPTTSGSRRALTLCAAVTLAACTADRGVPAAPAPRPGTDLGAFVADVDVQAGTVTVTPLPGGDAAAQALSVSGALVPIPVVQDGVPLQGPPDTVELRTLSTATVPDGCGPGAPSFEAAVRMESFYAGHALLRPHLEIQQLTPLGHESCAGVPSPEAGVTDDSGLFPYPDIPPLGGATATWSFRVGDATSFRFIGRVVAELAERTAPLTTATPAGGTFGGRVDVSLGCEDAGSGCADTFYSLDGSAPSVPYVGPIAIAADADLCFRSIDVAGNVEATRCAHYATAPAALSAAWDATLRVPRCTQRGRSCDSGTLLAGRGPLGPESQAPNTIGGSCADGTSGVLRVDESLERLVVTTVDGGPLAPGAQVRIDATVFAWGVAADSLDLYSAPDASAPVWTHLATLHPAGTGVQTISTTFTLPAGATQAIRANFRYLGSAGPCTSGGYDDHDDLVFATATPAPVDGAPPAVALTSPAGGASVSRVVLLRADASDDVAVTSVEFWADGVLVATDTAPPWIGSWDTTAASGVATLSAIARDAAGRSTRSAPVTVTVVDRTPPTVATTGPAEGAQLGADEVALAASATDARGVALVRFFVDGVLVGSDAAGPPWAAAWDTRAFADGTHTIAARATDASGNVSASAPVSVVLDRTAPGVALAAPLEGDVVSASLVARATAEDAGEVEAVEFLVDGVPVASDPSAPYEVTLSTSGWTAGPHAVSARARDLVGNAASTGSVTVTVLADAAAPAVAVTTPGPGAFLRAGAVTEVAMSASDDRGVARVELWVDGAQVGVDAAAPWAVPWTPAAAGAHLLEARAWDAAGNEVRSAPVPVTVDGVAPGVALTAPEDGATVSGVVALGATASDDGAVDRVEFLVDGRPVATAAGAPYGAAWDSRTVGNGPHLITATAYDRAGNATSAARALAVRNGTLASPSGSLSPRCNAPATACLSGALLEGRNGLGTEVWPSTSWNVCPDGTSGGAFVAAIDASSEDGGFILAGRPVRVEVTAVIVDASTNRVDVFADEGGGFTLLQTFTPSAPGRQSFVTTFTPSHRGWPVLRANLRVGGSAVPCTTGAADDHDELGLFVTDNASPPSGALTAPLDGATLGGLVPLAASASDDTGVASVRFILDGNTVVSTATAAPYAYAWNSAMVPDGPHTLGCEVSDVSGHVSACANAATVTVSNTFSDLAVNGGFESGSTGWTTFFACPMDATSTFPAHGGARLARIWSGQVDCSSYQTVTIPATGTAQLRFWLNVVTTETGTADVLAVTVRHASTGAVLATLGTFDSRGPNVYVQRAFDLTPWRGQTVRIHFADVQSWTSPSYFLLDDVEVLVTP